MWKNTGAVYNGEWRFGKYDGYGTYYVLDPESKGYVWKYDGEWKNGKKHVCIATVFVLLTQFGTSFPMFIDTFYHFSGLRDLLLQ